MYETQNVFKCIMDVRGVKLFEYLINVGDTTCISMYNVDVRDTKCTWIWN